MFRAALAVLFALSWTAASPALANDEEPAFRGLLTGFSFEVDEHLDTGPDTLRVFEHGAGHVSLGTDFRTSGSTAVVLRDVPGDGDFPELQGFFEAQRRGRVWLHFDLLLTSLEHEMNIALAGPGGFGLGRDGIAFWLGLRTSDGGEGWLVHVSDSIPRRLFRPRAFTWSKIDVVIDLDAATYDLFVREEGRQELTIDLRGVPTAARHRNAAIDKFSFIGDRGSDDSDVEYWIDDVVVATEDPVRLTDFTAPGRRTTFVERLGAALASPTGACLPVLGPEDFAAPRPEPLSDLEAERLRLRIDRGWEAWRVGCGALERGDTGEAIRRLDEAARLVPRSMAYAAARVLARMEAGEIRRAEEALVEMADRFYTDPRWPILVARVAEANGDLDLAAEWLGAAGRELDTEMERIVAADHVGEMRLLGVYGLLLRTGDPDGARRWAERVADRQSAAGMDVADGPLPRVWLWWERAADAAFLSGAVDDAERIYESALARAPDEQRARLELKLADALWRLGDVEGERRLREGLYGRLD